MLSFFSQYDNKISKDWQYRSCGLVCLQILFDYYNKINNENKNPEFSEILKIGLEKNAYLENIGWRHKGLVEVANFFNYTGYNRDLSDKKMNVAYNAILDELRVRPVIISVKSNYDENSKGGHLIIVEKIEKDILYIIDPNFEKIDFKKKEIKVLPIGEDLGGAFVETCKKIKIHKKDFLKIYKKRLIIIRPKAKNRLEELKNAKIDIFKSYLAMIKNSVGTKMFKNFYVWQGKKSIDAFENGNVSCAAHVSNILFLWGLIDSPKAKTENIVSNLEKFGWYKINKPKIGCLLVWEPVFGGKKQVPHIGFYVGKNLAISNSSEKSVPTEHHFTYNKTRKITAMYFNDYLNK